MGRAPGSETAEGAEKHGSFAPAGEKTAEQAMPIGDPAGAKVPSGVAGRQRVLRKAAPAGLAC